MAHRIFVADEGPFHWGMWVILCGIWVSLWLERAGLVGPWHVGSEFHPCPEMEPASSVLKGRFLTTGPPGKSPSVL